MRRLFGNLWWHCAAAVAFAVLVLAPIVAVYCGRDPSALARHPLGLMWALAISTGYPIWAWMELSAFERWVRNQSEAVRKAERAYFASITAMTQRFWAAVLASYTIAGVWGLARSGSAEPTWPQRRSIPEWADAILREPGFDAGYTLSSRINPFLLHGDFDGDGRGDLAVLIRDRKAGADGIAIVHAGASTPIVVGAGRFLGSGGSDFSWLDAWQVYPKGAVQPGPGADPPPTLLGDALRVEHGEEMSALIYWNGAKHQWYPQGE